MDYSKVKKIFESIIEQAGIKDHIKIDGKTYPSHQTFKVFRNVLLELKKDGETLIEFKENVIEADYFERAGRGELSDIQIEFLYDIVDLLNGNCPAKYRLE